jgi:hypothetical protein
LKAAKADQLVADISKDKTIAIKLLSQAEADLVLVNDQLAKAMDSFNAVEKNLAFAQNISEVLRDNLDSENAKTLLASFNSNNI